MKTRQPSLSRIPLAFPTCVTIQQFLNPVSKWHKLLRFSKRMNIWFWECWEDTQEDLSVPTVDSLQPCFRSSSKWASLLVSPLRISEELPPILRRRIFTGQIMCHSSGSRRPNQSPQVSGSEEGSYSFRISLNMLPHRGRNSASRHPKGHSALRVTIYHISPHQKDNPRVPVSRLFKIYVINHQEPRVLPLRRTRVGYPSSDNLFIPRIKNTPRHHHGRRM